MNESATARPVPNATLAPHARLAGASDRCSSEGRATVVTLVVVCLAGCSWEPRASDDGLPRWWREGSDETAMKPEQQQRQEEVDMYNAQLYAAQGWELVDTTPLVPRAAGLLPWFFLGGPGGKAPGCK